jgi:hypothetical protein
MSNESSASATKPGETFTQSTRAGVTQNPVQLLRALIASGNYVYAAGVGDVDQVAITWMRDGVTHTAPSDLPGARLVVVVAFDVPASIPMPQELQYYARPKPDTKSHNGASNAKQQRRQHRAATDPAAADPAHQPT